MAVRKLGIYPNKLINISLNCLNKILNQYTVMDNRFSALKTNIFKKKNAIARNKKTVKKENTFKKQNNFKPKKHEQSYQDNNKFMSYTDNYYQKEEPKKEFELKDDDFPTLG